MDLFVFSIEIVVKDYFLDGIEEGDYYNVVDFNL